MKPKFSAILGVSLLSVFGYSS